MLSSVLRSERAVQVNIQIMRIFTRMRHIGWTDRGLRDKLDELEKRYDGQFDEVFEALRLLTASYESKPSGLEEAPSGETGFSREGE